MPIHSRFSVAYAAALVLAYMSTAAHAHHAGGVGNAQGSGPINTISASTLEHGRSVAGIAVDYTSLDTLSDATLIGATAAGIEDLHGLDTIQSHALNYSYGVTNDLTLTVRLPYVRRNGVRAAEEDGGVIEVEDHGSPSGIGDLSLLGRYRFLNDLASRTEAAVLLGIKTPTGKINERDNEGQAFDAEFQPGSGSWDGLFGLALTHRAGLWSFDANVLYTMVTEGTQSTNLGDLFLYNAALSYRLTSFGGPTPMFHGAHSHADGDDGHGHTHSHSGDAGKEPALDLVLEVNGEWQDQQETAGVTDENSGGNAIYISPGLRLSIDQWSGFVSFGIPIVNDLNGIQSEPDWRLSAGTSLSF